MLYQRTISLYAIVILFSFFVGQDTHAALLYLSPSAKTVQVGQTFVMDVRLGTQGDDINASEARIIYPSDIVEVRSVDYGGSIYTLWVSPPRHEVGSNAVSFAGGVPGTGYKGNGGLIARVTFRAMNEGVGLVTFESGRSVIGDGRGLAAAGSFGSAKISVIKGEVKPKEVTKEGVIVQKEEPIPAIICPSHPDESSWYSSGHIVCSVEMKSTTEVAIVSTIEGIPPDTQFVPVDKNGLVQFDVEDGLYRVVVRYNGNNSASERIVRVDTSPPEPFTISLGRHKDVYSGDWFLAFEGVDKVSGVGFYDIKEGDKQWEIGVSPYRLNNQFEGMKYRVQISMYDQAGNVRVELFDVRIPITDIKAMMITLGMWIVIILVAVLVTIRVVRKIRRPLPVVLKKKDGGRQKNNKIPHNDEMQYNHEMPYNIEMPHDNEMPNDDGIEKTIDDEMPHNNESTQPDDKNKYV